MKLFKKFISTILFLFFSTNIAQSCLEYQPDEKTDEFRKAIKSSYAFNGYITLEYAPNRRKEIKGIEQKFPGFKLIEDHLSCDHCGKNLNNGHTIIDRFSFLKERHHPRECWYDYINCIDYAFYTIILEDHPNKDAAISIISYCMKNGIFTNGGIFNFIELQETNTLEEARLLVYEGVHYAINGGNGVIESKWGSLRGVFQHGPFQVPFNYGDKASLRKVVFKEVSDMFVKENWPNPSWNLPPD